MSDTATGPWREALDCVDTLLSRPQEARASYLSELAVSRPDLHARVSALLDADAHASRLGFMDVRPRSAAEAVLKPDARLGPYRVVRELGRGGMGEVWLAQRDDGLYQGEVAIKTLHPFFAHGAMRERFLREAQLLGRLAHPHIARLLDAGVSDGVVYLVLEYVRGDAIDIYCDARQLRLDARLKLFDAVCAAVAHAHANLIVHRDIKPSNILVTQDGEVKLLDFGIGKLVETEPGAAAAAAELTRITGRIFTPEYAAPEQILGEPVTTATDVYSLGVLLYSLLSGTRPHASGASAPVKIEHAVLHEEAKPLGRAAKEASAEIATARGTTPARLQRDLAGDLENITSLALRKLPRERYASVLALAEDLARYARHEPVQARAGSRAYRLDRFVRRHRVAVAATAGVVLAATFGIAGVLYQAREAREQARVAQVEAGKATAVKDFLLEIFNANSERHPDGARARQTTAEELLDLASERILASTDQDPELRSELMGTLTGLNLTLEKYPRVKALANERLRMLTEKFGADDLRSVPAHLDLAEYLKTAEEYDEARAHAQSAIAILEKHGRHLSIERASAETKLGEIAYSTVDVKDPAPVNHYQAAIGILEQLPHGTELVAAQLGLARAFEYTERYDDSIVANRRGVELALEVNGPRHTSLAGAHQQLGRAYVMIDHLAEAAVELQKAVDVFTFAVGADNGFTTMARMDVGRLKVRRQQYRDCIEDLEKVLALKMRIDGDDDRWVQQARHALGRAYLGIGDFDRARVLLDTAVAHLAKSPQKSAFVIVTRARAQLAIEDGRPSDALADTRLALSMVGKAVGPRSLTAGHLLTTDGEALLALRRFDEANKSFTDALDILKVEDTDPVHGDTMAAELGIAATDLARQKFAITRDRAQAVVNALSTNARRAEFWVVEELANRRLAEAQLALGDGPGACAAVDAAIGLRSANALPTDPRLDQLRALRNKCAAT
jgi:serine/threonine protein kinase